MARASIHEFFGSSSQSSIHEFIVSVIGPGRTSCKPSSMHYTSYHFIAYTSGCCVRVVLSPGATTLCARQGRAQAPGRDKKLASFFAASNYEERAIIGDITASRFAGAAQWDRVWFQLIIFRFLSRTVSRSVSWFPPGLRGFSGCGQTTLSSVV